MENLNEYGIREKALKENLGKLICYFNFDEDNDENENVNTSELIQSFLNWSMDIFKYNFTNANVTKYKSNIYECMHVICHTNDVDFNKPIGNGIITALNMRQAVNRSIQTNTKKPNKGSEAANAVISILKNEPKKI